MEKALVFSLLVNIFFLYKITLTRYAELLTPCKHFIRKILTASKILPDRSANYVTMPEVYCAKGTEVIYISNQTVVEKALALPNDLIIEPGEYLFDNVPYALCTEGLYRFMLPLKCQNAQRIVWEGKDVNILMSALSWIISHGHQDDKLNYISLKTKAKTQKLILTCEAATRFAKQLLSEKGIASRIVGTRTLSAWNTYNDGHYLIEVYCAQTRKWILYDLDHDLYFHYQQEPLSLLEFMHHFQKNDYEISYLSSDLASTVKDDKRINYDFCFINEGRVRNLKEWYQRVMQFIFIEDNAEYFSAHPLDTTVIARLPPGAFPPLKHLNKEAFCKKFYDRERYESRTER